MIGEKHTVTRTGIVIGGAHIRTAPWWAAEAITGPHTRPQRSAMPLVLAAIAVALVAVSVAVFAGGPSESDVALLVQQQVEAVAKEIK